jgi:hypothetical protein
MDSLSKLKKDIVKHVTSEEDVLLYSKAIASFIDSVKKNKQPIEIVTELQDLIVHDLQKHCAVKGGSSKLSTIAEKENDNVNEAASAQRSAKEKAAIEHKFSIKADDNEIIRGLKENAKNFNLELWDRAHRTNKGPALSTFDRRDLYCRVLGEKHLVPSLMNVVLITNLSTIITKLNLLLAVGPAAALPTFVELLYFLSFCTIIQQMIKDIKSDLSTLKFRGKLFENENNTNVEERENILIYLLKAEEMLNKELKAQAEKAEHEHILQGARSIKASRLARNLMNRTAKERQRHQQQQRNKHVTAHKGRGGTRKLRR